MPTWARPRPVLPAVASMITPPGLSRPSASAASIMVRAMRSLIEPPGLALSSLVKRRQARMKLERRLVDPARMDVQEVRVPDRAIGFDEDAARLGARRGHDLAQRRGDRLGLPRPGVETAEDGQLHTTLLRSAGEFGNP